MFVRVYVVCLHEMSMYIHMYAYVIMYIHKCTILYFAWEDQKVLMNAVFSIQYQLAT